MDDALIFRWLLLHICITRERDNTYIASVNLESIFNLVYVFEPTFYIDGCTDHSYKLKHRGERKISL